jgi:hypothetical protein
VVAAVFGLAVWCAVAADNLKVGLAVVGAVIARACLPASPDESQSTILETLEAMAFGVNVVIVRFGEDPT